MRIRGVLTAVLLLAPAASFAANKEMEALQRDVALMSEDIRTLQRSFDQQMAALKALTQQAVDNSTRISTSVGVVQQTLPDQIKREMSSSLAPVAGLNTRLDQVAQQVQTLSDAVQALNQSMQQLHNQLTDLKTVVAAINVPAAPPPNTDPNAPNAATTPQIPIDTLYQNAMRDMNGNNRDFALSEFQNCVKWYPQEPLAASCQFYVGMIHASKNDFDQAVKDFDAVLEQFPKGDKTPEAFFYKGLALVKSGNSRAARKEFNSVIQQYPHSAAADKAREQLKGLGFSLPPAAAKKR
jgi:tol-pal system protein YbgF